MMQDIAFHFLFYWLAFSVVVFPIQYILRRSEKMRGLTIIALLISSVIAFMNLAA